MDLKIEPIKANNVYAILQSPDIPNDVKRVVANQNKEKILNDISLNITSAQYAKLLETRPLKKGRPIKNSLIKRADDYILSSALGIEKNKIKECVKDVILSNFEINENMTKENIELVKQYIYRHGKKDDVLKLLEYELSDVAYTLVYLYKILKKNSGGLYDYFKRPIHLLDNRTAEKMHKIIKTSLNNAQKEGTISPSQNLAAADFALKQIYNIQSDYKILKAAQIVKYQG